MNPAFISFYETSLGTGAVAATDRGVCRIWLPGDSSMPSTGFDESELSVRAASQLLQYFGAVRREFDLNLDICVIPDFSRMVLELLCTIPFGALTSYKSLAKEAGAPSASRAVGRIMASNPVPVLIPCHRVLSSDGRLTGYSGAGGIGMKKWLLAMEGHTFQGDESLQVFSGYKQKFF